MVNEFLSLDWGTSSFRLRLVATADLQVIAEEVSEQGIAATFQLWQQQPDQPPQARVSFYTQVIATHISALEKRLNRSLQGLPLLLSGMASSTIGLMELAYLPLPFAVDGTGIKTHLIKAGPSFQHDILLISGVRSNNDVMRGEETQLIGGLPADNARQDRIFIFPGTHSKHVLVQQEQAVAFKTYMTGEFFELLAKKSILSATVAPPAGLSAGKPAASFENGVQAAVGSNLLHAAFLVRTNNLFGVLDREENFNYLSGLLIGTELQELLSYKDVDLYLFGGARLQPYYEQALKVLGLGEKLTSFPASWVDQAVVRGQYRIFEQYCRS